MNTLLIHARKGLYQLTICSNCNYLYECENCDAKLVTYREGFGKLELVCHQCQTYYQYPDKCPRCESEKIISKYGGIDELEEILKAELNINPIRLDKKTTSTKQEAGSHEESNQKFYLTTRIFDPGFDYSIFQKVIIIQAENLLASPDYLVQEDTYRNLIQLLISINSETELVFDTNAEDVQLFQEIVKIHTENKDKKSLFNFYHDFLNNELKTRQAFNFPPFKNLLLLTVQEKKRDKAWENITFVQKTLAGEFKNGFNEVTVSAPYPARFLRRKNLFSYHVLVRFPRQYEKFSQFKQIVQTQADRFNLQVRLNPRHLF